MLARILPCPVRQVTSKIEDPLNCADAIEAAVEPGRQRAEKLEQSIPDRAFRDELIPHDPNEESAVPPWLDSQRTSKKYCRKKVSGLLSKT